MPFVLTPGWDPGKSVIFREDPRTHHIVNLACAVMKVPSHLRTLFWSTCRYQFVPVYAEIELAFAGWTFIVCMHTF